MVRPVSTKFRRRSTSEWIFLPRMFTSPTTRSLSPRTGLMIRSPWEEVVAALFRDEREKSKDRPRPKHKRVWAPVPLTGEESSREEQRSAITFNPCSRRVRYSSGFRRSSPSSSSCAVWTCRWSSPTWNLGRGPGEGARGHLPQDHPGEAFGPPRDRDLGRRPPNSQLHVHRRLRERHAGNHAQRYHRTDQSGKR
jgi:hypothetical protein